MEGLVASRPNTPRHCPGSTAGRASSAAERPDMQTVPLDIDAKQLVRWVMAERRASPARLRTVARYEAQTREIPPRAELHLGDVEREDLSEVETVATLEITPVRASDGWRVTVVVEDEAGPRLLDKRPLAASGEQIDVQTFYSEFIGPERGIANVEADVADDAAAERLARLVSCVETNRHDPDGTTAV